MRTTLICDRVQSQGNIAEHQEVTMNPREHQLAEQSGRVTNELNKMKHAMKGTPGMPTTSASQVPPASDFRIAPFHNPHPHRVCSNKSIPSWDEKAATSTNVRTDLTCSSSRCMRISRMDTSYDAFLQNTSTSVGLY